MRVVAGSACHFPFAHGVVRTLIELCSLGEVTLIADIGLLIPVQYRIMRDVNLMATGTGYITGLVQAANPLDPLVILVTFETFAVLLLDRCPAVLAEVKDRCPGFSAPEAFPMFTAGSVAGLALQARERCAFVGGNGVPGLENREYGVLIVLVMALEAGIRTALGIFTLFDGLHRGSGILKGHSGLGFPGL